MFIKTLNGKIDTQIILDTVEQTLRKLLFYYCKTQSGNWYWFNAEAGN